LHEFVSFYCFLLFFQPSDFCCFYFFHRSLSGDSTCFNILPAPALINHDHEWATRRNNRRLWRFPWVSEFVLVGGERKKPKKQNAHNSVCLDLDSTHGHQL
jgi:hypothetical protein